MAAPDIGCGTQDLYLPHVNSSGMWNLVWSRDQTGPPTVGSGVLATGPRSPKIIPYFAMYNDNGYLHFPNWSKLYKVYYVRKVALDLIVSILK